MITGRYTTDYYELIDLPRDASSQQIWGKIVRERQKAHNQLHAQDPQVQDTARERIHLLDEAIRVLLNTAERDRFDQWLERQAPTAASGLAEFREQAQSQISIDKNERAMLEASTRAKAAVRKAHAAQTFDDMVSAFDEARRASEEAERKLDRWEEGTPTAARMVEQAQSALESTWTVVSPNIQREIAELFRVRKYDKAKRILGIIGPERAAPVVRTEVERLIHTGKYYSAVQLLQIKEWHREATDEKLMKKATQLRNQQRVWFELLVAIPGVLGMIYAILNHDTSFWLPITAPYLAVGTFITNPHVTVPICLRSGRPGYVLAPALGVLLSLGWPLSLEDIEEMQFAFGTTAVLLILPALVIQVLFHKDVVIAEHAMIAYTTLCVLPLLARFVHKRVF